MLLCTANPVFKTENTCARFGCAKLVFSTTPFAFKTGKSDRGEIVVPSSFSSGDYYMSRDADRPRLLYCARIQNRLISLVDFSVSGQNASLALSGSVLKI